MSTKIPSLDLLVHELSKLPGIGEKTAQRLAYFVLRSGDTFAKSLSHALLQVRERIRFCAQCFAYTESASLCAICESSGRDNASLCVVEEPSDLFRIENANAFHGLYHVLHGSISPLEGVRPEDLKIKELIDRVEKRHATDAPIREIIFALNADLEGDTTSLYLAKQLANKNVKLTRIAYGVPFGSDIDFIDRRTLGRALENRVEL